MCLGELRRRCICIAVRSVTGFLTAPWNASKLIRKGIRASVSGKVTCMPLNKESGSSLLANNAVVQ